MPRARAVDENAPHDSCGHREKVDPVRPIHATHVDKPNVRLAHESRCLETLAGRFASHASCGDLAQLVMNERNELPERGFVAAAPGQQQRRDVSWVV